MRRNISNKLLIISALLGIGLSGCSAKRGILPAAEAAVPASVEPAPKPVIASTPVISNDAAFETIRSGRASFNTVSIKAKAGLNINGGSNDVNLNIRVQKDKMIWISVTALAGLEVARALITPDSVKILDRVGNEYTKKPFSYIYEFTSRQLNFNTLQDVLLGNAMPEFVNPTATLNKTGTDLILSGILETVAYEFLFDTKNRVANTKLKDQRAGQFLTVAYSDYISVSGQLVPHSVNIRSASQDRQIGADLKYNKVEIDGALEFPFNVPQRFSVKK